MDKLKYWVGSAFCTLAEILFLLAFVAYAFGQWFRTKDKKAG